MNERVYIPGQGSLDPKIVILGESPGSEEIKERKPFVGPSGRLLNQLLSEAGINREASWITNVCKYFVTPNLPDQKIPFGVRAKNDGIDLSRCLDELRTELSQLQPNIIIALGGTALWALTGKKNISNQRGSILSGMGFKVIATYHPAHILHGEGEVKGYYNKQVMLFDLKRAAYQSQFKEIILPNRSLNICQNSAQLYDFIQRNSSNNKPAIDIEAIHCIPACIGIAFNKQEGITIPLWNTNDISTIPDSDMVSCWCLLSDLLATNDVIGQNFGYDRDKIRRLGFIVRSLASDTMLKAFTINPELPKNLAFNTSIYTEEPYYKDEGMYL